MKPVTTAVATIAIVLGLAAAAQAAGNYQEGTATTGRHVSAATHHRMAANHEMRQGRVSKEQIREAQQQLKSEGLFKGRVDGRMNKQFKLALSRFQQQNGLRQTAKLDQDTLARLGGGTSGGAGVGSSMPSGPSTTTPAPTMNAPTTTAPSTGAGGANTNPSSTTPAPMGAPKQP